MKIQPRNFKQKNLNFIYFKAPEESDPFNGDGSEELVTQALVRLKILKIVAAEPELDFYLNSLEALIRGSSDLEITEDPSIRENFVYHLAYTEDINQLLNESVTAVNDLIEGLGRYVDLIAEEGLLSAFIHSWLRRIELTEN